MNRQEKQDQSKENNKTRTLLSRLYHVPIILFIIAVINVNAQAITLTELINIILETGTFSNPDISMLRIDAELV